MTLKVLWLAVSPTIIYLMLTSNSFVRGAKRAQHPKTSSPVENGKLLMHSEFLDPQPHVKVEVLQLGNLSDAAIRDIHPFECIKMSQAIVPSKHHSSSDTGSLINYHLNCPTP